MDDGGGRLIHDWLVVDVVALVAWLVGEEKESGNGWWW